LGDRSETALLKIQPFTKGQESFTLLRLKILIRSPDPVDAQGIIGLYSLGFEEMPLFEPGRFSRGSALLQRLSRAD
jgi:hypothetical protein